MGKYFSIEELTRSTTAANRGIDNTPSPVQEANLKILIDKALDPIRERWGKPIFVNSGFRCAALNKAVGGVATSQHIQGCAADITAGSPAQNEALYHLIIEMGIEFDQLIDEKGFRWIHISYKEGQNRKQAFKL